MTEFVSQITNGLVIGGSYALVAIGLTMVFGIMDVLNFAHGEFYMMGGLFAFMLVDRFGVPYFPALAAAVLLTAIVGWLIERVAVSRLTGNAVVTTAIATIGLSLFFQDTAMMIMGPVPQPVPSPFTDATVTLGGLSFSYTRLFTLAMAGLAILLTHYLLNHTRTGLSVRATFQDRQAASLSGINVRAVNGLTFAFGSALSGLAGALLGTLFWVSPFMGSTVTLKAWVVVIMGGLGNVMGAIGAGALLGVVESLSISFISPGYKDAIGLLLVIWVLLFRPRGLFGRG